MNINQLETLIFSTKAHDVFERASRAAFLKTVITLMAGGQLVKLNLEQITSGNIHPLQDIH